MLVPYTKSKINTEGSTLIVPSVSIGNVPQLAVDLIVNTLSLTRVGILASSSLLPISGPPGYDHLDEDQRSVPLEIFQTADAKWTVLQQRSPPLPKHHRLFAQETVDFIKQGKFSRVVLLTSSDAALRGDALIDGPQIRSLSVNCQDEQLAERLQALSLSDFAQQTATSKQPTLSQLHSAGIARPLLSLCEREGIEVIALVSLVNEGDNIPDAILLANATNALLGLSSLDQWHPPKSWAWLMPANTPSFMF
ncbi:hypothetical protein GGI25_000372 [Coemansia spiralis]|uniref:Proteasome assembly chaperone 2 n=2 Tax=Coemansia TaxID=4863 RepID=A0A9W8GBW6_9FUNG|nr:PAC2 family-domain-containing protein [Coemansia spiralis]KAJ1996309.1 hypothetical protein EDC05_000199 [Coemansia umbellata]KAJ2625934.1 hypothetical protein GGI26_000018 [Coemansia sp. RSA 1358]KAJ2680737.1 hypothetical protein GGI25_000372 [Coemansia spiralis]